jgi:hypothetical protein
MGTWVQVLKIGTEGIKEHPADPGHLWMGHLLPDVVMCLALGITALLLPLKVYSTRHAILS